MAADLQITTARPLFESTRRPIGIQAPPLPQAAPKMQAAPAAPETSGFRLVGVIVSDERTTALLVAPGKAETFRVEVGDSVDGWSVEMIKLSHVTVHRQGKRDQLRMQKDAAR